MALAARCAMVVVAALVVVSAHGCTSDGAEPGDPALGRAVLWPANAEDLPGDPAQTVRSFFADVVGREPDEVEILDVGEDGIDRATAHLDGIEIPITLDRSGAIYSVHGPGDVGVSIGDVNDVHTHPAPEGTATVEFIYRDDDGVHHVTASPDEAVAGVPADASSIETLVALFRQQDGSLTGFHGGVFGDA